MDASLRLPTSVAALLRVLRVPRVLAVEGAFLAFTAVEFGTWVAILVYAYITTGPASVGLVAVVQLVPAAVVAPLASTLGDHLERHRALALAHAGVGAAMAAVAVAMASGAPPPTVYAFAIVAAASLTTVRPIQSAILPALVGTAEQLTAANALSTVLEGFGVLVGPLAAGVILSLASPGLAFGAAAGLAGVAALLVVSAGWGVGNADGIGLGNADGIGLGNGRWSDAGAEAVPGAGDGRAAAQSRVHPAADGRSATEGTGGPDNAPPRADEPDVTGRASPRSDELDVPSRASPRAGVLDGLRAVAASPGSILMVSLVGVRFAVIGAMDVVLVFTAIELLGMGDGGAGYLNAAVGFGSVLGGVAALVLVGRLRLAPFLLLGGLVWFLPVAVIAIAPSALLAVVQLAAAGIGLALFDVSSRTLLQRLTRTDTLARVFGVVETFTMGGLAVGALLAAPLVDLLGVGGALVACGVALPVAAGLALPAVIRDERAISIPLREIALLRRLALFAPLPAGSIESAARAVERMTRTAGTMIIREGDVGDRFYVIESGEVLVTRARVPLRTLGAGDAFGEIALIRRVPRTASVLALSDVELVALDRDQFLLAITGTPKALDEADRVVERYVAGDATGRDATGAGAGR